ncbi:hypothetical protein EDB87DRAFT_1172088 [Lactarius vividus]|nr:hypothetical protein EDB87DRAFT_1172088 [Lactarius vividus]
MHEMVIPVESESHISVALGNGNEQAGRSTPPVALDLMITVSANGASPSDPHIIPTGGDDTATDGFPKQTMTPDFSGLDRSSAPGHLSHPTDRLPVESSTFVPQDQGETSLVENDLIRVDQVDEVIDHSNTWEGAVGKIKWRIKCFRLSLSINATKMSKRWSRACTMRLISQTTKTL